MLPLYCDVQGEAYRRLIDYAMERSKFFVLAKRHGLGLTDNGKQALGTLEPYLIETRHMGEMMPDHAIAYSQGTYYIYKCCPEAAILLKDVANSLFEWQNSHLPEDLCFWDEQEQDFLYNVAHESMAGLNVDGEEATALSQSIPGLFFQFSKYRDDFELFIDDAIYHQPSKLNIEMNGINEIPDRISQLRGLKELVIFEQNIRKLPRSFFELTEMEALTIYTADLEEIPADIGKMVHLKSLTICCGSYHSISDPSCVIPKEGLSLTQLPPEVGNLINLENLHISYTAISKLPDEMESLVNLRTLNLNNNMIMEKPSFLSKLTNLTYIDLGKNPFSEDDS
ncbi:leucine-rich repeat domain-containing protein [Paenibacillus sp. GCM10028914]|uniref:leucine-rich repeat domain-containing protein n=1 Tax=Paenibacillus sp. GCM10028914 TaxID=3273416 RepID=UPI00361BC071